MVEPQAGGLAGLRLLIVEDEYALTFDLAETLEEGTSSCR